jgi:hypothetical protein
MAYSKVLGARGCGSAATAGNCRKPPAVKNLVIERGLTL